MVSQSKSIILFGLALAILVYVIWQSATILLLLFLGGCLAVMIHWCLTLLQQYTRLPHAVATLVLVGVAVLVFFIIMTYFVPAFFQQLKLLLEKLPQYQDDLKALLSDSQWGTYILYQFHKPADWLSSFKLNGEGLLKDILGVFSDMLTVVSAVVFVTVVGFYLAYSPQDYVALCLRGLPRRYRPLALDILRETKHRLRYWLLGQGASMLILGCATTLVLTLLQIPFALILGSFTALMTFIPNFGPMIAAIPIVLITLLAAPEKLLWVGVFYVALQNLEGFLITPQIQQRAIRVPAVMVLLAQLVLVTLWGVVGIIAALPMLACGSVLMNRLYLERLLKDSMDRPLV